uniref:RRM domain-containing protein n=1 Tax=Rhizophora mucronata TaxID=61149 RepID=A0A2P2JN71_RHIMU
MNAFKPYGEIEDCKAVCDKVSGKSKGYGFILFKKRSGAHKALKQPQKKIGNRMTACQLASIGPVPTPGSTSGLASGAHSVSEYTQRKIYVSNVGAELDPQKLTAFFSKYGEIEEGPLGLDKFTGRPKGFCLFVYKTVEGAKRALEEPHKNFEGHVLNCQKAVDGPKSSKLQQQQHHHNVQRNDNNPAYSGVTTTAPPHLMAPAAAQGIGFTQGAAATVPALNPALGQALTALLATQGAGLGLTNLLGTLGSAPGMSQSGIAVPTTGMQGAYANQASISPGLMGVYGNQGALQVGYPNQQMGQGSSGRGQHAAGQYGGTAPYMGH